MTTDAGAFSDDLESWLHTDEKKTLGSLGDVFAEKSFAVAIMLLMFLPALPIPTGGVTHVFEAIAALLAFGDGARARPGLAAGTLPGAWARRGDDR